MSDMWDSGSTVDVDLLEERATQTSLLRVLRVHDNEASLAGHFPGRPVVPAIVQLQWAIDATEQLCGTTPKVCRLEAVKFKGIIRPGQVVEVAVDFAAAAQLVRFRVGFGEMVFSTGRCVLSPRPDRNA